MTGTWNNLGFLGSVFPSFPLTRFLMANRWNQPCWMRLLWYSPSRQYWTPGFLLRTKYRGSKCKVSIFNSVFTSAGLCFSSTLFVAKIFKCRAISVIVGWMYTHFSFQRLPGSYFSFQSSHILNHVTCSILWNINYFMLPIKYYLVETLCWCCMFDAVPMNVSY